MLNEQIKQAVEILMQAKGIKNPTQLAEKSGIPQPTLSRCFSGKHKTLDLDTTRRLARFFGITIDKLIGDEPLQVSDIGIDEFKSQLDWFYKNLSLESQHMLVAHANLLWSVENPEKSKANPFPVKAQVLPMVEDPPSKKTSAL